MPALKAFIPASLSAGAGCGVETCQVQVLAAGRYCTGEQAVHDRLACASASRDMSGSSVEPSPPSVGLAKVSGIVRHLEESGGQRAQVWEGHH